MICIHHEKKEIPQRIDKKIMILRRKMLPRTTFNRGELSTRGEKCKLQTTALYRHRIKNI